MAEHNFENCDVIELNLLFTCTQPFPDSAINPTDVYGFKSFKQYMLSTCELRSHTPHTALTATLTATLTRTMKVLLAVSMLSVAVATRSFPSIFQVSQMAQAERRLDATVMDDTGDDIWGNIWTLCQTESDAYMTCISANEAACGTVGAECTCDDDEVCAGFFGTDDDADDDADDDDFAPTSCDDLHSAACTLFTNSRCTTCSECATERGDSNVCEMEVWVSALYGLDCDLSDACTVSMSSASKAAKALSVLTGLLMFGTVLAGVAA